MHMAKLTGTSNNDTLTGTNTADEITGRLGDDVINGGAGNDILYGDMLIGEENADLVTVISYRNKSGDDVIHGGQGNDKILDYFGKDEDYSVNMLFGDDGNDTITGSGTLNGGRGDDTIKVLQGNVIGGKGNDTITTAAANFKYVLSGNDGNDTITGNNILNGGAGDDILTAKDTATLHGGAGDDILKISNMSNILWGNQGNDTFKITADATEVYIKDFMKGQDHIDLSSFGFNETPEVVSYSNQYVKLDTGQDDMNIYVHVMKGQTLTSDDFIF